MMSNVINNTVEAVEKQGIMDAELVIKAIKVKDNDKEMQKEMVDKNYEWH